ncbi:MAG: hypothetical protein AB7S38_35430 [Vulcanimicrobiota bacterium]
MNRWLATFCLVLVLVGSGVADEWPIFRLRVRPQSLATTTFAIRGTVVLPAHHPPLRLLTQEGQEYGLPEVLPADLREFSLAGTSRVDHPRCQATGDEIYCLTRVGLQPELEVPAALYEVDFELPDGYAALISDPTVPQSQGLVFQVARLAPPFARGRFQFVFPLDFDYEPKYLDWIVDSTSWLEERFGPLGLETIKVGAIGRGGNTQISGTPSGNLILYSRTALGAAVDHRALGPESGPELVEPLRRLVIAHEISHFWFGLRYLGHDGWMVEGIPQYLAWRVVAEEFPIQAPVLLAFFERMARANSKPVAHATLEENPLGAYYQGPLVLHQLGEAVGHGELIQMLQAVYKAHNDPTFEDFEREFQTRFPANSRLWAQQWG